MDGARFDALVNEVGLSERLDELRAVRRPAVGLVIGGERTVTRSRAGGDPLLPATMAWPVHDFGPYAFTAQLDFEEIARACGGPDSEHMRSLGLPIAGLLSVFHGWEEEGEFEPSSPGFIKAWYHPRGTTLEPRTPPEPVHFGGPFGITFTPTFDVPANRYQWPWDGSETEWAALEVLRKALLPDGDHLLGYPNNLTLAYDPTPGPEWSLVLNLRSREALNWHWNDGDRLSVFCPREKLSVGDFTELVADAG